MRWQKIHITGASGSGTTSLGRALAARLGVPFFDSDDFFWKPTSPPYQEKRSPKERLALILNELQQNESHILSGSICRWDPPLEKSFDAVVYLSVRTEVRIARLEEREQAEVGFVDSEFINWASQYDTGGMDMRSRILHEKWLESLTCPILKLDGERYLSELIDVVINAMAEPGEGDNA